MGRAAELESPGDVRDAGLAGLAGGESPTFLVVRGAGPARAAADKEPRHEDLQHEHAKRVTPAVVVATARSSSGVPLRSKATATPAVRPWRSQEALHRRGPPGRCRACWAGRSSSRPRGVRLGLASPPRPARATCRARSGPPVRSCMSYAAGSRGPSASRSRRTPFTRQDPLRSRSRCPDGPLAITRRATGPLTSVHEPVHGRIPHKDVLPGGAPGGRTLNQWVKSPLLCH